jgi:hypothetical protein
LFPRENTLMAQPFDANRLSTTTHALPVAEQIQHAFVIGRGTVSENRFLVHRTGPVDQTVQLAWLDRSGKQTGTLGQPEISTGIRLSADRKRAAVGTRDVAIGNRDIWLYDVAQGLKTRFTSDPAQQRHRPGRPMDAGSYSIQTGRDSSTCTGSLPTERAQKSFSTQMQGKIPNSFSPDGKSLLYMVYLDPASKDQLWILPVDGTSTGTGGDLRPARVPITASTRFRT